MTVHLSSPAAVEFVQGALMEELRALKEAELAGETDQYEDFEELKQLAIEVADAFGCNVDWDTLDPEAF